MTNIDKVRLLIGDQDVPQNFADADIQAFLDLSDVYAGNDQIFMAAALGCDQQAKVSAPNSGLKLGDYSTNKGITTDFQTAAQRYRDIVCNTPAFAIAEKNLSGFSELEIIRNYVLRTGEF